VDRSLADDLRDTLASAHEAIRDLLEEGVELFERDLEASRLRGPVQGRAPASEGTGGAGARSEPKASEAHRARVGRGDEDRSAALDARPTDVASGATLEAVRQHLGDCTRCRLAAGRTHIVFGDGDPDADLLFVGEGPGEQEDLQGIPFVGRAGELLTQMIERGLSIPRRSVYICNIVKCRPPQNRTPLADEVAACRGFLDGQIDAVRPKVIVALGKPATSLLLGRDVSITRVRGILQEYRGIPLMPTYHPAFVLRQYTPENRRLVWDDLKAALALARERGGRFDA
jgi:DNA polymerase